MKTKKETPELMVKICGITQLENALAVAAHGPTFMGFILYPASKRYICYCKAHDIVKQLPKSVKKVAVLVNHDLNEAVEIAESCTFDLFQLHGNETPEYCRQLSSIIPVIKAFGVADQLPANLSDYADCCSFFLFDTQSDSFGGTGQKFNHQILEGYNLRVPYFISGGIGPEDITGSDFLKYSMLAGVDANSRLEVEPGIKEISKVENLIKQVKQCSKR